MAKMPDSLQSFIDGPEDWDRDDFDWTELGWGTDDFGPDALELAQKEYEAMPERAIRHDGRNTATS